MIDKPSLQERYNRLPFIARAAIELVVIFAALCVAGVAVAVFGVSTS
jgi:hypothetical protein